MGKQRKHQTICLSFALGGPDSSGGTSMEKAHEGMNIQEHDFEAIAPHLERILQELGANQEAVDEAMEKAGSLKECIVNR